MPADQTEAAPEPSLVVAVDDSPASINAARFGGDLAKALELKPKLLHIGDYSPSEILKMKMLDTGEIDLAKDRSIAIFETILDAIPEPGWEATIRLGELAAEAAAVCKPEHGVRFLVVGRRKLGAISRLLKGSVSKAFLGRVACPVLIVPGDAVFSEQGTWVVATDLSEASNTSLDAAAELAALPGSSFILAHAYTDKEEGEALESLAQKLRDRGAEVSVEARKGSPLEVIPKLIKERQATGLIIATQGRSALAKILVGSVTEGLLKRLDCPMLVARARRANSGDDATS